MGRVIQQKKEKVLVTGAGGFIGSHLVRYLKKKGYWVRGVDSKFNEFTKTQADEFLIRDLRFLENCLEATRGVDHVYNLAADMGGMGFISSYPVQSLHNSNLINTYGLEASLRNGVKIYFFSSSACVYPIHKQKTLRANTMKEEDAYPALPNEAYGWEKLIHEIRCQSYYKTYGLETRIARFGNCYGVWGVYEGGREKAPAALCRKVALAKDGDTIEVWGDGKQTRSFMYIDDCVEGIYKLMRSDHREPLNLGSDEVVTIDQLAKIVIKVSGRKLAITHVRGPQGVRSRYIDHTKAAKILKWRARVPLEEGIGKTYKWVKSQIDKSF